MDFCRNVTATAGEFNQLLSSPAPHSPFKLAASIDDLFPVQNTEVDVSLEWLSVFVEDCLSSTGNGLPPPPPSAAVVQNSTPPPPTQNPKTQKPHPQNHFPKFIIPSKKARTKRTRRAAATTTTVASAAAKTKTNPLTSWSSHMNPFNKNLNLMTVSDPPLLQQAYWLADSELIVTKSEENNEEVAVVAGGGDDGGCGEGGQPLQPPARRCRHCLSQRTPQWRAGPMGPKTLCNACGVRYKSGRLLPEYRPAKSPTFVSYLHSNSHKKVMEIRLSN